MREAEEEQSEDDDFEDDDDNDDDGHGGLTELVRDVVGEIFGAPLIPGLV